MIVTELLKKIQFTKREDVKLYFVTRAIKPGISKRTPAKDKYLFNVFQMDCDDEVRSYLYDASVRQLNKTIQKNYEMLDYDILTDETEHLFTYNIQNKVFSFNDVVTNKLLKTAPKVTSIANITVTEELWAYCVEFFDNETEERIYTFRKILPSKVGVDENAKNWFRAKFSPQSQQLTLLKEETVNLDEQIDCIYHQETFYVIKKANFEQIVGLQEEYKEKALEVADNMINCGSFIGGGKLKELIEKKPSIHKKLIKVEKLGKYKNLTPKTINVMKKVLKKYGETLPIVNEKLSIESEDNIDAILKAFGDYYKKGEISGIPYGTFAGKELQPTN